MSDPLATRGAWNPRSCHSDVTHVCPSAGHLKRLVRINQRLKDKGLDPISDLKDFDEKILEDDDFKLQETGNILVDYILVKKSKKLAEKK